MTSFALRVLGIAVVAGLSTAACPENAAAGDSDKIAVTGTMTAEGVPCLAMRGDDGVLYTFRRTPLAREFRPGDRIEAEGTIAPASICQQGTTIIVTRARKLK